MERSLSHIANEDAAEAVPAVSSASSVSLASLESSSAAASPNLPSDVTSPTTSCPRRSTASDLSATTSATSSSSTSARARTQKLSNNSSSSRPSSVASNSSQSSHQGQLSLQPNLLSPTLASALGINITSSSGFSTGVPKQRSSSRPSGALAPDQGAGWGRRPSLPNVPSMINRVSMISIASFESLPEGESVSFANSPLSSAMSDGENELLTTSTVTSRTASSAAPTRTLSPPPSAGGGHAASPSSSSGFSQLSSSGGRPSVLQRSSTDPNHLIASYEFLMKKRRNVAMELVDTERLFVASLKLINESYYQPLMALSKGAPASSVASSSGSAPLLSRKALAEIFSNFPDILQLNSELLVRLDDRLSGRSRDTPTSRPASLAIPGDVEVSETSIPWAAETDSLGDILVPLAPFLKMYGLFVQNFSSALARIEAERKFNEAFNRFLRDTERATWGKASASGGFGFGLGFQAHLLTIVQRIPRYKMLVGDLVKFTPSNHRDYADLAKAYQVIEQVASYINENIRQHEMILVMIGLQRSLIGLPEPLVVPGRSLLKRGALLKACRRNLQYREFFLFSDCLVYASAGSGGMGLDAWQALARGGGLYSNVDAGPARPTSPTSPTSPKHPFSPGDRPPLSIDTSNYDASRTRTSSAESNGARPLSLSVDGQQLQFRGKFALQDCTVVGVDGGNSNPALRHSFEIRTPNKSFAVYAETFEAKEAWLTAIRDAREDLMTARRTLQADEDSIEAKRDRRRTMYRVQLQPSQLQHIQLGQQQRIEEQLLARRKSAAGVRAASAAIPEGYVQTAEDEGASAADMSVQSESTVPASGSGASLATLLSGHTANSSSAAPRAGLRVLEDYNAPVWVPDSRADKCICCTEAFGIWRRKHHCRLCGQVVCWACSTRSFLIARYEDGEGEEDKPARACDACYDSVFPAGEAQEPLSPPPPLVHSISVMNALETYEQPISPRSPSMPLMGDVEAPSPTLSDNSSTAPRRPALAPVARPSSLGNDLAGQSRSTSSSTLASSSEDTGSGDVSSLPLSLGGQRRRSTPLSLYAAQRAPGPRIARATGAKPSLFSGSALSPQVQAATSGSGTFRLCTPRLTTPEAELPPSEGGVAHVDSYFSPGASSAVSTHDDDSLGELKANFARPRKKPLSAAARLSTFYKEPTTNGVPGKR